MIKIQCFWQLALIEELWDSLAGQPEELPLTQAQRQELDRRIDEMDGDDTLGVPWEEVLKQIREQPPLTPRGYVPTPRR